MIAMRLKLIETVDFRKNEATNYAEVQKKYRLDLGRDDVICFFSIKRNQVVFVHRPISTETRSGLAATVCSSVKLRLSRGMLDALMIQNYANEVGIHLINLPRMEEFLAELGVSKALKRKAA